MGKGNEWTSIHGLQQAYKNMFIDTESGKCKLKSQLDISS